MANPILSRIRVQGRDYDIRVRTNLAEDTTGILPVANGGTGAGNRVNAIHTLMSDTITDPELFLTVDCNGGDITNWNKPGHTVPAKARKAIGLGDTTDALGVAYGGTGATTPATARTNLGLNTNSSGALVIAKGGTGATTAAEARTNLEIQQTTFHDFSGSTAPTITAQTNREYYNNTNQLTRLTVALPSVPTTSQLDAGGSCPIFGISFNSSSSTFTGVTFNNGSVSIVGDSLTLKGKRYNLIVWYDSHDWWCAVRAK